MLDFEKDKDILDKEFKIDTRGYRPQEVDKFLDIIIKDYNEYNNIIKSLEKEKRELSQREISKTTNLSLGTVNKTITSLLEKKLINEDNTITKRGLKELEPYRVKRAIFLAAGFGSRLVPITLNTPKPLVLVNGKKIIETLLDAVVKAEIPEIIIVTGYLNEQFEILLKKYPNIKFIYNKK